MASLRFPTCVWRNTDTEPPIGWVRDHNAGVDAVEQRAGFYGLDIYNTSLSIAAVLDYLDEVDPPHCESDASDFS